VTTSARRVVFVGNASRHEFSIELDDIASARLETKRAWPPGLEREVCLVLVNASEVRLRLIVAATLRGLVRP
jgi:ribosomal protein L28